MSPAIYLILFLAGLAAGVINTMAGGGSVLTLPALILAGIPATAANATNRLGVVAQSAVGLFVFRRGKAVEDRLSWRVLAAGIAGSIPGALIAAHVSDEVFEKFVGLVMIGLIPLVFIPHAAVQNQLTPQDAWSHLSRGRRITVLGVFFLLGVYSGLIQAGVGILVLLSLSLIAGLDMVRSNYIKLLFVLIPNALALIIFIQQRVEVYWVAGIVTTVGQACGGYIGGHVALRKGEKAIKLTLVIAMLLLAVKLLGLLQL